MNGNPFSPACRGGSAAQPWSFEAAVGGKRFSGQYAGAEVKVPDMRQSEGGREPLTIVFPEPCQQPSDHLLVLLEERFRATIAARQASVPAVPKK